MLYRASCHCGAVVAEVEAPTELEVEDCNCSICYRSGILHLIVPQSRFRLLLHNKHLMSYLMYYTRFGQVLD